MRRLVEETQSELMRGGYECEVVPVPGFAELYEGEGEDVQELEKALPKIENDVEKVALILHSSGT